MTERRIGEHHAPHPSWRPEWPPGSVIIGRADDGKFVVLPPEMRKLGLQIVGLPNQGKSKLMESMARQDILALCGTRRSVIFIDPHGTSYVALLNWLVTHGIDRLVPIHLLDLSDPNYVFHLNPLKRRGDDPAVPAAAVTNAILKGVWGGQDPTAMPQAREALKICFTTLSEFDAPLIAAAELLELDDHSGIRAYAAENSTNPLVRAFWRTVEAHSYRERDAMLGSARRRLNEFLLPRRTREVFSEAKNVIDWRHNIMDAGGIALVNLNYDAGNVSEDEATTVGALILSDIFLACRGREPNAIRTYVYVDECHRFATEDSARLFTEARKFNCHPILAHQIFEQLEKAGSFIKGSIMSARNKIFFGGLPPEEAQWAAEFAYRGNLELAKPHHLYDKPVAVDHIPVWLTSESESHGSSVARGTTTSRGGGTAYQESTTTSRSDTIGESFGTTEGHSDSRSGGTSDGTSSSGSSGRSGSSAQGYDLAGLPVGGPTVTDGWTTSDGAGSSSGSNSGWGSAETSSTSHAQSVSSSDTFAETTGTTTSTNWSRGKSTTQTTSESETRGRAQTLKPVLKVMPTQGYTLPELIYEAAAEIAGLPPGHCLVKIGQRPAQKVQTVYVKDGWARPQHIERVKARSAARTLFVVPIAQAALDYLPARALPAPVEASENEPHPAEIITERQPLSPPLKDDGWG